MDALIWPDLDDVGYEFHREALLAEAEGLGSWHHQPSQPYRLHWQYGISEPFPACGTGPPGPLLTRDVLLVTCRRCRGFLAAASPQAVAA